MCQVLNRSLSRAGEKQGEHFDDTLLVMKSSWQFQILFHELSNLLNVGISGPVSVHFLIVVLVKSVAKVLSESP